MLSIEPLITAFIVRKVRLTDGENLPEAFQELDGFFGKLPVLADFGWPIGILKRLFP
jgi:hypothetical protein